MTENGNFNKSQILLTSSKIIHTLQIRIFHVQMTMMQCQLILMLLSKLNQWRKKEKDEKIPLPTIIALTAWLEDFVTNMYLMNIHHLCQISTLFHLYTIVGLTDVILTPLT